MEALKSLNPFTGEMIGSYAQHTTAELEDVIQAAHSTFKMWSQNDHQTRCLFIEKLGAELEKNKHRLASLITGEMGKPLKESLADLVI
ncbi:MAG TPA: aldehyde dehydrogenase family protein, partial [Bacteroidales bacterium]|nr:aldehyde dehydrogenase family protein [Bacteroidales bacterium]